MKTTPAKTAVERYERRCSEGGVKEYNTENDDNMSGRLDKNVGTRTKKTFSMITPRKNLIKKKIDDIQHLTENDNKCLIGSGRELF